MEVKLKFNLGDEVYILNTDKIEKGKIIAIDTSISLDKEEPYVWYTIQIGNQPLSVQGIQIYKTKLDLIKHLIDQL